MIGAPRQFMQIGTLDPFGGRHVDLDHLWGIEASAHKQIQSSYGPGKTPGGCAEQGGMGHRFRRLIHCRHRSA